MSTAHAHASDRRVCAVPRCITWLSLTCTLFMPGGAAESGEIKLFLCPLCCVFFPLSSLMGVQGDSLCRCVLPRFIWFNVFYLALFRPSGVYGLHVATGEGWLTFQECP